MSLRTRIALGLALASLAIVSAIAVTVYALARQAALEQLGARLGHLASGLVDRLETGIYERTQDVRILAEHEAPRAAREGAASLRAALERRQRSHPEFSWIGFTDAEGKVIAATGGLLEGVDVSARPWWAAARNGQYIGDVHEAKLLANLLRPEGGEPLRFFDIALPVADAGRTVGIVGAHLGWDWARALAAKVIAASGSGAGLELLILSREGKVLLGPPGIEGVPLVGELASPARGQALGEHPWPDGQQWFSVMRPTPAMGAQGPGWRVVARQPSDLAMAPLDRLRSVLVASAVAAVLVASILGYLLASLLARPLERWAHAADRIGAGDRAVQFPDFTGSAELQRLSAALRSMAVQLGAKEDDLRARIEERTAALVEAIAALEAERERLAYALEGSRLATWDLDVEANEVRLSAEWARMLGEPDAPETVTTPLALLERVPAEEHSLIQQAMTAVLRGDVTHYDVDHRVRRADGTYLWIRSRGRVTRRDAAGRALRLNGTNADISTRKRTEHDLARQAFTDPVTLLPNRRLLADRLGVAVARARRAGSLFALLYADLDGFKTVNDTLGHVAGDELLREVGGRIAGCVREADTVARIGGDEFAVVLDPVNSAADAEAVAAKILAALAAAYALTEGPARVTASIGIAVFPEDGADADALTHVADTAMYRAKAAGRNRVARAQRPGA